MSKQLTIAGVGGLRPWINRGRCTEPDLHHWPLKGKGRGRCVEEGRWRWNYNEWMAMRACGVNTANLKRLFGFQRQESMAEWVQRDKTERNLDE